MYYEIAKSALDDLIKKYNISEKDSQDIWVAFNRAWYAAHAEGFDKSLKKVEKKLEHARRTTDNSSQD